MARSEVVVYKGIEFRRYPDSPNLSDSRYFRPHAGHIRAGMASLHREIWKDAHGPIPPGHHIHHKDGNPSNNTLSNLECVPAFDHLSEHGKAVPMDEARREALERIRPLAAEWHRSEEGRAWHVEHGIRSWEGREPHEQECGQCGASYETRSRRGDERFCSNRCKAAWRRASGVDDEERECAACSSPIVVNKYSRTRTCSLECAWVLRRDN